MRGPSRYSNVASVPNSWASLRTCAVETLRLPPPPCRQRKRSGLFGARRAAGSCAGSCVPPDSKYATACASVPARKRTTEQRTLS
eukprot:6047607-Prymnesium_polylepis.2